MKLSSIVDKASQCKTDASAAILAQTIESEFKKSDEFCNFEPINNESYIENGKYPHIHFSLSYVVSNDYIIDIRPEIRDHEFNIRVTTNKMNDGLGIESHDWEEVDETELKLSPDDTLQYAINFAKSVAIQHHKALIESVGLEPDDAEAVALKCWDN